MQCTGALDMGKQKTALLVYLDVIAVFCLSICLPLQRLPSSQEDLWRLTSLVKAHESNEQKPQPILPSSTPFCYFTGAYCHTAAPDFQTMMWQCEPASHSEDKKKTLWRFGEWHVWIFPVTCFLVTAIGSCCAAEFLYASNPLWVLWCTPKTKSGKCEHYCAL